MTESSTLVEFTRDQADILVEARESHDQNTGKLKACESDYIRQGLDLYLLSTDQEKRRQAEALLVYFWNQRVESQGKKASTRSLFHQVSAHYKEYTNGRGVIVEDDKLTLAATRKKNPLKVAVGEIDPMLDDEQRERLATILRAEADKILSEGKR